MKLFIDSAKLYEIRRAVNMGCCGCTTNPSLIKQAVNELVSNGNNISMEEYIMQICEAVGKGNPVSLEVINLTSDIMIEEAKILHKKFNSIADNVVIKIPVNTYVNEKDNCCEGLKAIRELKKLGIKTNATLVMTPEQALLAKTADYISPFAGRIDDFIRTNLDMKFEKGDYFPPSGIVKDGNKVEDNGITSGVDLVKKIVDIFCIHNIKSEVIAASIRNARQVREVALAGSHIATIPFSVLEDMAKHTKTIEGVIKFSEDVVPEYKTFFNR